MSDPYIQCAGRRTMDLLNPRPEDIHIPSMAWSLAHINRFTGHGGQYSVAEHLVLGTRHLQRVEHSDVTQLRYLFHDAHEAYTGDMSQPTKRALRYLCDRLGAPDIWKEFEQLHEKNMEKFLGFMAQGPKILEIDLAMLISETDRLPTLDGRVGDGWPDVEPLGIEIMQWTGEEAFREFMYEVTRLAPMLLLKGGAPR